MKRIKSLLLILGVSGPVVVNLSCSGELARTLRDAMLDGTSGVIEAATAEAVDAWVNGTGE
ncbi:MAG: hypothetical protein AABZ12_06370 [Planctomycetota bacterium]